jgi:hypothetical protein
MQYDRVSNGRAALSREDAFILEKHAQDILMMLLGHLLKWDKASLIPETEQQKSVHLLTEYHLTKTMLATNHKST